MRAFGIRDNRPQNMRRTTLPEPVERQLPLQRKRTFSWLLLPKHGGANERNRCSRLAVYELLRGRRPGCCHSHYKFQIPASLRDKELLGKCSFGLEVKGLAP